MNAQEFAPEAVISFRGLVDVYRKSLPQTLTLRHFAYSGRFVRVQPRGARETVGVVTARTFTEAAALLALRQLDGIGGEFGQLDDVILRLGDRVAMAWSRRHLLGVLDSVELTYADRSLSCPPTMP